MTTKQKQEYLTQVIEWVNWDGGEWDGMRVTDLSQVPDQYRGEALLVNDHGNVTLYRCFKNGNYREIASRV